MAKTSGIKSLLYAYNLGFNEEITNKIQNKEGIDKMIEVNSEKDLIEAIDELLR